MIPLDATNQVPIDLQFLREFTSRARTRLGRLVTGILETERPLIEQKIFYAWDPLAAVALTDPGVVTTKPMAIKVRRSAPQEGRTEAVAGRPNASVALDADSAAFRKVFVGAFE